MMVRSRISLLLLTVLWACGVDSGTNPGDTGDEASLADDNVAEAIAATIASAIASMEDAMFIGLNIDSVRQLDDFSFAESNALFLEALAMSPSEDVAFPNTALLGAAVTGIFLLEDDPAVRAVAEDWEAWLHDEFIETPVATLLGPALTAIGDPITLPLGFSTGTVEQVANSGVAMFGLAGGPILTHGAPAPSVAEAQTVLRDLVRPALTQALRYLVGIADKKYTFTVSPRMQGELPADANPLELDYTEILAMRASLQAALAAVDVATAYVVTPNPFDPPGFVDAMTAGSTFLTLAPEGANDLADALVRLQATGDLLLSAMDELEAETDDQTDDIVKVDPLGNDLTFNSAQELADARALVQDILDALSSPTVVTVNKGDVDEYSFTADARQFFTNPIADLKLLLAPYEVFTADEVGETIAVARWLDLNLDEWTFPDPTFNNILPAMSTTSDLLNTFSDLDEFFFDFSLASGYYQLITVDGVDCLQDVLDGGSGCHVSGEFYSFGSLFLGGHDGMSNASLHVSGSGPTLSANGTYVVVDNMDGTYTMTASTVLQDPPLPLLLTGTLTDNPGFASIDALFRYRGGSSITVSFLGSAFVFERQDSDDVFAR